MGWRSDFQDEVPNAEKPEAGRHGSWEHQDASLAVLPDRLTGQYLNWTKNRPIPQCPVVPAPSQTREHLIKVCPEREAQKIPWAEVRKETGRWKDRWKIRDLQADDRCGRAVLAFLFTTDVGRRVPAEGDAVNDVSGVERREWEGEQEAEELGAVEGPPLSLPTPDFMASAEED